MCRIASCLLLSAALVILGSSSSFGVLVNGGDVTIIDDAGNPSDGLRYLDLSFSDGLDLATALTNIQMTYFDARLATPSEFDDLFAAAGISYDGAEMASDGFAIGGAVTISSGANYDGGTLLSLLGPTVGSTIANIWTDPDGNDNTGTTRDFINFNASLAQILNATSTVPDTAIGWLIVTSVPEPSSFLFLGLATASLLGASRRRIQR